VFSHINKKATRFSNSKLTPLVETYNVSFVFVFLLLLGRVPDDKTINEILRPYIDPEKSDPVIRQRLKAYIRSQTGVQILMKVEYMQQNLVRYYELDPYRSLRDNLRNKVIIEYPTLHVVLKESSHDMEVLHQVKSESPKNIGNEN